MYRDMSFTQQIKALINKISATNEESITGQASIFYLTQHSEEVKLANLDEHIKELSTKAMEDSQYAVQYQHKLKKAEYDRAHFLDTDQELRLLQHDKLVFIAREILALAEGIDFEETQRKTAKLLATILLISPSEGKQVLRSNECSKPLYKAVLCLRLFDQLYMENMIKDKYILSCLDNTPPYQYQYFVNISADDYRIFTEQVKIPLIMLAILQDIGNHHPMAKQILYGETLTANPYRTLEANERKKLLQINYTQTMKYILYGIGAGKYIGNFKVEKEAFDKSEKRKLIFMKSVFKSWANSQSILGNLLKVPQIYTSIVLSTKPNFDYRLLPKVYQVLQLNVDKKHCHAKVVELLYKITGMFPLGYGITYIPKDSTGQPLDRYEYAIVTHLNPKDPMQPECRVATRSLAFISRGQDICIEKTSNLFFPQTAKKLSTMSKERLNEILELLSSNYQERQNLDVIPRCWHAKEYFSIGKNQNLWNKSSD